MELLPLLLIVVVFWFLLIRPQRRRQQEMARTQRALGVGDEVMIGAGIYGTVRSVADDTLELEVAPGTTMRVARAAVVRVLAPGDEADDIHDADRDVDRDVDRDADRDATPEVTGTTDPTAERLAEDNEGRQDRG
jgi:preprotein translocase subunit YajC